MAVRRVGMMAAPKVVQRAAMRDSKASQMVAR